MRRSHFRVAEPRRFNGASEAKVTIEVGSGIALFTARPFRRRKAYTLPLATVAAWVIERCVRMEIQEKAKAKSRKRLGGAS